MSGVDQRLVEEISCALAVRDRTPMDRLFSRQRVDPPVLVWEPDLVDMESLQLSFLLSYWRRLRQCGDGLPLASAIDPLDMRPMLGHVVLVDVIDEGRDFRYRLFGSEVASRFGTDMTGRRTSEIEDGNYIAVFFLAQYRALMDLRHALFSRHFPARLSATTVWDRLLLPLADESGDVIRILIGQVPGPLRGPVRGTPGNQRESP